MATTFSFFHDSALTQVITSGNPLFAAQDTANTLPAVDTVIYLGSTVTGNKAQVNADPGVTPVIVSVIDANAGTGSPATEFRLALSSGGLATATPGAALELSVTLLSGVVNAVPIYTRRDSVLAVAGSYTDLSLETQELIESPV